MTIVSATARRKKRWRPIIAAGLIALCCIAAAWFAWALTRPRTDEALLSLAEAAIPHPDTRLVGLEEGRPTVRSVPSDDLKVVCGWILNQSDRPSSPFFFAVIRTFPYPRVIETYVAGRTNSTEGSMAYFCPRYTPKP